MLESHLDQVPYILQTVIVLHVKFDLYARTNLIFDMWVLLRV